MPPRKFAPTPIEETTKSSRPPPSTLEDPPKPKRFAAEPIETTTKSSRSTPQQSESEQKSKPRRFAPEPVEHTVKLSNDVKQSSEKDTKPKPRRFAPQLVDEAKKDSENKAEPTKRQQVKFKPEPIATTYGSKRRGKRRDGSTDSSLPDAPAERKEPRKFTPILLDTARRSRRSGQPNAPISQDFRTEYGYHAHPREHWRRVNGEMTPMAVSEDDPAEGADDEEAVSATSDTSSKLRRTAPLDGSAGVRPSCFRPKRQPSFRLPDLDTIESSESEGGSTAPSSPATPAQEGSPITVSDSYEMFKHATRRRESIDETFQHYLLDLERKKAQQRLEEQALAAYPNADFGYEHPHHYFIDDDDSDEMEIDERPTTWEGNEDDIMEMTRRDSTANLSWEQRELQRIADNKQQERNANKPMAKQPTQSPFMKMDAVMATAEADAELKSMRDRARPPMLGSDLVFPRCASPDPARFDVTQGATALRNQMCYLTQAAEAAEREKSGADGGLWQAPKAPESPKAENKRVSTIKSPVTATPSSAKGLWGGFCMTDGDPAKAPDGASTPPRPSGLMTPKHEAPNPFHLAFAEGRPVGLMTPETPTPKKRGADLQKLTAILVTEREIDSMMESEYPDSFITQVYNYLSLGYPSLARYFDDELSKISRIPIAELRQDDDRAKSTPRGYIRLGPDFEGGGGEGMTEESCMRWQALKRYVREWASQEKNWQKAEGVGGNWGTVARRGSWGL